MTTHNILQIYRNVGNEINFYQEQLRELEKHARMLERLIINRYNLNQNNTVRRNLFNNSNEDDIRKRYNHIIQRINTPLRTAVSSTSISASNPPVNEVPVLTPHPYQIPYPNEIIVEDVNTDSDNEPEDYQNVVRQSNNNSNTNSNINSNSNENSTSNLTEPQEDMVYLGTFDIPYSVLNSISPNQSLASLSPLSTSYAGSLANRLQQQSSGNNLVGTEPLNITTGGGNLALNRSALSSRGASFIIDYLFSEMLNRVSVNEDDPHGITDISPYVDVTTFAEITEPKNTTCPIRMDVFHPETEVYRIRSCGHIFNRNELRTWLNTHNTCPMCRVHIDRIP